MKSKILILLVICLTTGSCVKEKLETFYSKQDTQIDAYMTKARVNGKDTLDLVYNKGSVRLIKTEGSGPALEEGGSVSFYYAGYVFTSNPSSLFATNHQETAAGAGFNLTDEEYQIFEADMRSTQLLEGVRNGLIGVKSGEVCEIAFSGKYGFGDEVFGTIPVNSALLYKIWVIGVSNE